MYQRDYLLRIIEQLAHALIQLRNRILGRQCTAAELQAELRSLAQHAALDLDVARSVDMDTLQMLLGFGGQVDPGRAWLLAELLYLEALHAQQDGRAGAARRDSERALELYGLLAPEWQPIPDLPPAATRMQEVRKFLEAAADSERTSS